MTADKRDHHDMRLIRPPRVATALLAWALDNCMADGVLGDIEERYHKWVQECGMRTANARYWAQVLSALPGCLRDSIYWRVAMFKNYLIVAWRNISRHRLFSVINTAGLAIGMASFFMILLWVRDELSNDRFHKKWDRIYRVMCYFERQGGYSSYVPGPLSLALKDEYPEVEYASRLLINVIKPLKFGDRKTAGVLCGVERSFFDIFTFPFVNGNPDDACGNPDFIILTESTAQKLFPDEDPIGKTVAFEWWGRWLQFHVTGIIRDVPHNSHLQFDYLLPFSFVTASGMAIDRWENIAYQAYVLLDEKADPAVVNSKIRDTARRHSTADYSIVLQPLRDVSLRNMEGGGPIIYITIFSIIGALILLIACINFMNLSTARSASRSMEVGLRKVVGSNSSQLAAQFVCESIVIAFLAGLLSLLLVILFLPGVNTILGTTLALRLTLSNVLLFSLITLITGTLAGTYPAIQMARSKPVSALKGGRSTAKAPLLRKILIIFQFVVSTALIIMALIVNKQLLFIKNKDLGFNRDCVINMEPQGSVYEKYSTIKQELLAYPRIRSVTTTNFAVDKNFGVDLIDWDGKTGDQEMSIGIRSVDFDFQKTFDIAMKEGRYFSREFETDVMGAVILNETAVRQLGFEDPIGRRIVFRSPLNETVETHVIGVVKDFHVHSLHSEIAPLVLAIIPYWFSDVYIRMDSEDIPGTLSYIEKRLHEIVPDYILSVQFLDEQIASMYRIETRIGKLVGYGMALAIFVSCLGLFGLSVFAAQQRIKEIGIRKVLGSSVSGIVLLLSRELVKWVLLANAVAWPIAWLVARRWLSGFAYKIHIGLELFLISGAAALMVAMLTIGWQAVRAARRNPIDSLRYE